MQCQQNVCRAWQYTRKQHAIFMIIVLCIFWKYFLQINFKIFYLCDSCQTRAKVAQHRRFNWLDNVVKNGDHLHGASINQDCWKLDDFGSFMADRSGILISGVIAGCLEIDNHQVVVVRVISTRRLTVKVVYILGTHGGKAVAGFRGNCQWDFTFTFTTRSSVTAAYTSTGIVSSIIIPHLN